ncbi:multidrug resistance-associated protein 4 isoform X2 [Hemiscyllium ocellatum]|uniref:multidrug resistance-associated protein 4 isoform X2 n=1 Tax=Hemiscyllium ocellatum TaxID=170820 RepID=UPI0029676E71|nr:multidrug resistance-associated protein 4 isoform X2 [Hemiscyllium ocellatum]
MEPVCREDKPNPMVAANIFSKVFFCWLNPLFRIGYKRRLEENDLYKVPPEDGSEKLGEELQRYWDKEVQKAKKQARVPRLTYAVLKCFWKSYIILGAFTFVEETIRIVQPIMLGKVINYFENYNPDDTEAHKVAFGYAAGISLCTLFLAIVHHLYFFHVQRCGMKLRIAMCHMIYKKALRLSNVALAKTTTGQIVNLLSNDVNKFDQLTIFLHFLWVGPLQAIAVGALLWQEIGPSCLAGMVILLILMPTQTIFGKWFSELRGKTAILTDNRIRIMNEVISGMRIIKMYAWETPFSNLIAQVRKKEIAKVLRSSYLRALNMASFFIASKMILFFTFLVYVLLGNTITASRVFVTVSLYSAVRLTVTLFFPAAIQTASEGLISIRRIKGFLILEEIKSPNDGMQNSENDYSVHVQDLTCFWDKTIETPSLQNISFSLKPRELVAVIGPVGAGKSSILAAILGELAKENGILDIKGKVAYCAQQPWVFPGTVRSNILFGKDYQRTKYENIIAACALKRDLELFQDGDLTQIGDRGVTLSGGQKARINLARSVYQDADIYLLDDPLSAVDAEVGRHLFEQCITGVLKNKPRILVTHQLQYLSAADQILVLKEGQMVVKGNFKQLLNSGIDFSCLLKQDEEDEQTDSHTATKITKERTLSQTSNLSLSSSTQSHKEGLFEPLGESVLPATPEESHSEGSIGFKIYKKYFLAGANGFMLMVVIILNLVTQVSYVLQDWWLSEWATSQDQLNMTQINSQNNTMQQLDINFYLGIYAGLTIAVILFGITRSLIIFHVLVNASKELHNRMFACIIRAPVLFFDRNPIGRILNRFSKDIGHLDDLLPYTCMDFLQSSLQILGVIAVAVAVIPWILIPITPLAIVFFFLRRYYLKTSRDIKRMESSTRSPVFSHLSSSLQGVWTIRATKTEQQFQAKFDEHQDLHSGTWFLFLSTSRWLAVRLDALCAVFVSIVAFGSVIIANKLDAGQVGLALSYAITLMGMFQWGVRQSAEVENLMTSVERVLDYTELESEAPWESHKPLPDGWPHHGAIVFKNVNFGYSPDCEPILQDLNLAIKSKEKIGLVGRTGAGKSSLISALFRLAEPEGKIIIDGIVTSELGLHDLRNSMSIIPQDPVLFTGTVRKNLDPFDDHTDEALWNALEEVQLKEVIEELPNKMMTELAEAGSNFSVGQRQLVCLARAVLRKCKILIIDEATANVDPRTDELIQKTIRGKFEQCTVLTIAHRLNTIIDSDRILVLEAGRVAEYAEPCVLLENKDGLFYKMVQHLGKAEAIAVTKTAQEIHLKRKSAEGTQTDQILANGLAIVSPNNVVFESSF